MPLNPQSDNRSVFHRELADYVIDNLLKQKKVIVTNVHQIVRERPSSSDIATTLTVVPRDGSDFVEGDYKEESPKLFPIRHFVLAVSNPAKKRPKHRLDDVIRLNSRLHPRSDLLFRDRTNAFRISSVQIGSGRTLAGADS